MTRFFKRSHPSHLSAYEDGTKFSETSAYKIQTPGNYPEENINKVYSFQNFDIDCKYQENWIPVISQI